VDVDCLEGTGSILLTFRGTPIIDLLAQSDVPSVVIDRQLPARAGASAVLSGHRTGMLAAANALLDLGHRKIGLVSASMDIAAGRMRLTDSERPSRRVACRSRQHPT